MRNKVFALLFACTALFAFSVPTFAWQSRLEGNPGVTDSSPLGYYVWHDNDGLHVRTHGPGAEHVFAARFHTDGVITNLSPVRLERLSVLIERSITIACRISKKACHPEACHRWCCPRQST